MAFLFYPSQEAAHSFSLAPHVAKKLLRIQIGGLRSEKRLEAPTQIRASPWPEAVTFSGDPVVVDRVQQIGVSPPTAGGGPGAVGCA